MTERSANWSVGGERPAFVATAIRYGLSVAGPVSVSGAHFAASLIFLRELSQTEFGLFSFLLVVVPFLSISVCGSVLIAPLAAIVHRDAIAAEAALSTVLKMNLIVCVLIGCATTALMAFSGAGIGAASILGLYSSVMCLRWFGRGLAFLHNRPVSAALSDIVYSACLVAGLLLVAWMGNLSIASAAQVLLLSALFGLATLGAAHLKRQFWGLGSGSLWAYLPFWRDLTRWSLMGVAMSELTANAHAYLVTFLAGPKAFAVLAVGSLVMRPVSLVINALPDLERPRMARAIAAKDRPALLRSVNEFRTAGIAILVVTLGLAGALLAWFPQLILKKGYAENDVLIVIAIWTVIMATRVYRNPESVLLQAAGRFKPLATAGAKASVVSVVATLILLLAVGPIAALGGILLGELAVTYWTISLCRDWKAEHG